MRIAVSITAPIVNTALRDIKSVENKIDVIEWRLDYMKNPNLERLLNCSEKPMIVTNRHKKESGPDPRAGFKGPEKERIMYLQEAIDLGAEYIDIELNHFHELRLGNSTLIVSYHKFNETPKNLTGIYKRCVDKGADIVKIATLANSEEDCERMISLIERAEHDIIGICMGELGKDTRLCKKNYLTYAKISEGKGSADGQFTVGEMRKRLGR